MSGTQDVVVAAGIESMTRVPMFSATSLALKAGLGHPMSPRMNARYGVTEFSQFKGAQMIADKYGLTRDAMDQYSLASPPKATAEIGRASCRARVCMHVK